MLSNINILTKDSLRTSIESSSNGRNTVIYDDLGNPNHMVVIPKFKMNNFLHHDNSTHPAFLKKKEDNSTEEVPYIFVGKYLSSLVGEGSSKRLVSAPNMRPAWTPIDFNLFNINDFYDPSGNWHTYNILEDAAIKFNRMNSMKKYFIEYNSKIKRKGISNALIGVIESTTDISSSFNENTIFKRKGKDENILFFHDKKVINMNEKYIIFIVLTPKFDEKYDYKYRNSVTGVPISDESFEAQTENEEYTLTLFPFSEITGQFGQYTDDNSPFGLHERNVLQYIDGVYLNNISSQRNIFVLQTNYSNFSKKNDSMIDSGINFWLDSDLYYNFGLKTNDEDTGVPVIERDGYNIKSKLRWTELGWKDTSQSITTNSFYQLEYTAKSNLIKSLLYNPFGLNILNEFLEVTNNKSYNYIESPSYDSLSIFWGSNAFSLGDEKSYLISDNFWNGTFTPEKRWPWRELNSVEKPISTPVHSRLSYVA